MKSQTNVLSLLQKMIDQQRHTLLSKAKAFVPNVTEEDILQPMDYPELENNPLFRYEEGVWHGMQSVRAALLTLFKESSDDLTV